MKDGSWVETLRRERLQHSSRNPGLAALMSFVLMGLGQIYAGHIDKGIILICVHIGGLVTGYSMYTQGMAYDLISSWGGPYLIIPASYVLSVGMILIWIYNIKDAYYLSLFSEFRDWFEVERILVPYLKGSNVKLLSHHGHPLEVGDPAGEPAADGPPLAAVPAADAAPAPADRTAGSPPDAAGRDPRADEPEIIDVTATVRAATTPADGAPATPHPHRKRPRRPSRGAELLEESGAGGSWKMFGAVGAMVVLVGIWVWNHAQRWHPPGEPQATLFSLNGELRAGGAASGTIGAGGRGRRSVGEAIAAASASIPLPTASPAAGQVEEGLTLLKAGETASGVAVLEAALPTTGRAFPEAWRALRQVYFTQDQLAAYEDCLGRYLTVFPEDTEEWVNLGKIQFDRQSYVTASRSLLKALSEVPTHQRANFLMGSIYRELGLPEEAVPYLTKALQTDPLNTEFNRELAATHLALKDLKAARRHLERVMNVTATSGVRDEQAEALLAELESQERAALTVTPMVEPVSVSALAAPVAPVEAGSAPAPAGAAASSLPAVTNVTEGLPQGGVILYEAPGWSPRRSGTTTQAKSPPSTDPTGQVVVDIGDIAPRESGSGLTPVAALVRKDLPAPPSPADTAIATASPEVVGRPGDAPRMADPGHPVPEETVAAVLGAAGTASPAARLAGAVASASPEVAPVTGTDRFPPTGLPAPGQTLVLAAAPGSASRSVAASAAFSLAVPVASSTEPGGMPRVPDRRASATPVLPGTRPSALEPLLDDTHLTAPPAEPDLAHAVAVEDPAVRRAAVASGSRAAGPGRSTGRPVAGKPVPPPPAGDELKSLWASGFDRYLAGKWEESLPYFLKYLEKREDARVYDMVGVIFEKVGLPRDAFEATRRSYRMGQSDPQTLVRLGLLAEKTGEYGEGARYLDQALKKLPHRVDLVLHLAHCHREAGNPAAARALLQKLASDPKQSYAVKRRVETELSVMNPPASDR